MDSERRQVKTRTCSVRGMSGLPSPEVQRMIVRLIPAVGAGVPPIGMDKRPPLVGVGLLGGPWIHHRVVTFWVSPRRAWH